MERSKHQGGAKRGGRKDRQAQKPALATKFEQWLKKVDWRYEWSVRNDSNTYVYRMGVSDIPHVGGASFRILVDDNMIQSYAYLELRIPNERIGDVVEFLTRANFGLRFGNFEFDYEHLQVRYHLLHVRAEVFTRDMAHDVFTHLFRLPSRMFERYAPGFKKVIEKGVKPKKAVEACEK